MVLIIMMPVPGMLFRDALHVGFGIVLFHPVVIPAVAPRMLLFSVGLLFPEALLGDLRHPGV